ncbi:receptor-like protein EIX2 [Lactuca sativa]|uniref:receptor-like protein EIX2 n=1 Tax=Lactuca sativa TaxID=4236 RepID=UPI000CAF8FEA|nr:receptor-like protein EIX2 [Lactuca sativa]
MNPCVFIIFSLLLPRLETTTANQLAAVEGEGGGRRRDDNGVMKKCLDKEKHALLHFKALLQDPSGHLSTWRADEKDCCKWRGVSCNMKTGHVTELELNNFGLVGEINHSLFNLSRLNLLDLSFNSFHGTIPSSIGSLTRLRYLYVRDNDLNGTIPKSIGSLIELRNLDLANNSFYGTIPREFGNLTNLQWLSLQNVGRCRVENPEWLSNLSHLEQLDMNGISLAKSNHWVDAILSLPKLYSLSLQGCELSQVMHPYSLFSNSSSSIEFLYLGNNNLVSSMSHWLFPLTSNSLVILDLSSNMLDGIPKYLGNLCSLELLELSNNSAVVEFRVFLNNLSGCTSQALQELHASHSQFTGPLSDDIQTMKNLVYIDINSCKLGPRIPKWIQTLKNLSYLDISNNRISDTIPLDFWDMWPSQLRYLNLSSNNIGGKVPDLSSNFVNGSVIDLSSNNFYGPITNVSSTVALLNLSRNKFCGGISLLCQVVHGFLVFLDLSHNFLSGQLPDCLWHFNELIVLNLEHNNLFGRLPTSVGSLIKLEALDLYKNNFSEELPLSLSNCTSLNSLNLGVNNFSGSVPLWIGESFPRLYVLILSSNNFSGTIPLQLCQLAGLQILDLSMNHLHGSIPSCLDNFTSMVQEGFLPTQNVHSYSIPWFYLGGDVYDELDEEYIDHAIIDWQGDKREFIRNLGLLKSIDLSSNNLTGQIPAEVTNLYGLLSLNLSKNSLHGEIPEKIGQMKQLESLDLSRNKLSGEIPSSMSSMNFLNHLDMSYNSLSGRIPSSTQLQSFEPSRYNGNAGLCGPPLTKKCPGDEVSKVPMVIGESADDGEDVDEIHGWFYIGLGMGFATGFWIACGVLLVNNHGRHAFFHFYDSFRDWVYVKVVLFFANMKRVKHT